MHSRPHMRMQHWGVPVCCETCHLTKLHDFGMCSNASSVCELWHCPDTLISNNVYRCRHVDIHQRHVLHASLQFCSMQRLCMLGKYIYTTQKKKKKYFIHDYEISTDNHETNKRKHTSRGDKSKISGPIPLQKITIDRTCVLTVLRIHIHHQLLTPLSLSNEKPAIYVNDGQRCP